MRRWYFIGMLSSFALGCFSDPDPAGASCANGASGCSCYGNGTCDADLICNADGNCVAQDCQDGSIECPCYGNGTCDAGLTCDDNICRPMSGGSGTSASGSASATSTTTSPPPTSGSTSSVDTGSTITDPTSPRTSTSIPTGPADTGFLECEDCGAGQACFEGSCMTTPYVGCTPGAECAPDVPCLTVSTFSVCAPPCKGPAECPTIVDGFAPACEDFRCVIPCSDSQDCPASAPACENNTLLGLDHCAGTAT